MKTLLDKLERDGVLTEDEFVTLLQNRTPELAEDRKSVV